jgi:UDP-N-acetylglucosamine diphosphorylase / glucose-1-phosphate thymidylyltransferase / UDP-N-acetylgalactosamine diphosphorylase / glucosamine-1-phosphate N-acetyltransferase / galactosamine-1-phosphate N-acetyltransferase
MNKLGIDYFFEDLSSCPCNEHIHQATLPWDLMTVKNELFQFQTSDIRGFIEESVIIKGLVSIGEGTLIDDNVTIQGPVYIGKNCIIRSDALIRPYSVIGDYVVVGHNTEIKNSLIFNDAKMASHAVVSDSIIGKGTRIGSGMITDNRRFDQQDIIIRLGEQEHQTHYDKFGLIAGDFVRIGSNCSTLPGTVIGKYTWFYSNMLIYGFYEKEKFIKLRQTVEVVDKKPYVFSRGDKSGSR